MAVVSQPIMVEVAADGIMAVIMTTIMIIMEVTAVSVSTLAAVTEGMAAMEGMVVMGVIISPITRPRTVIIPIPHTIIIHHLISVLVIIFNHIKGGKVSS